MKKRVKEAETHKKKGKEEKAVLKVEMEKLRLENIDLKKQLLKSYLRKMAKYPL